MQSRLPDYSHRAEPAARPDYSARAEPELNRSFLERTADNLVDGFQRGPMQAFQRLNNPSGETFANFSRVPEMGIARSIAQAITGEDQNIPTGAADRERQRRADYSARASADPIRNVGDATAFGVGQVIGGALDPTSYVGGGGSFVGKTGVRAIAAQVGRNAVSQGAANAGADVIAQGLDVAAGTQDRYEPLQTAISAGVGAAISGIGDTVPRGIAAGGRAVDARISNPLPDFSGRAMETGPVPQPRAAPQAPRAPQAVTFAAPVSGRVTSGFGPRTRPNARASSNHQGVDYGVPEGTAVAAAADGEVIYAGPRGNYGNRIEVRHADGSITSYSHLSGFDARVGDRVTAGQQIARSGSTGNVTGPHLHFEVREGGGYVDPIGVLNGERIATPDTASSNQAQSSPFRRLSDGPLAQAESGPAQRLDRPALTPEQQATITAAASDPSLIPQVREIFAPLYPNPREARNTARTAVYQARRAQAEAPAFRPDGETPDLRNAQLENARAQTLDAVPRAPEQPAVLAARPGPDARTTAPDFSSRATPESLARTNAAAPDYSARAEPERLAVDMSGYANRIGQTVQSGGHSVGGLRDAPRPGAIERGQGATYGGKTVSDLAADLRSALGITHRQGRVGVPKALGTYNTASGVVRTKAVDELDVLAHEATHALEFEIKGPALSAALATHAKDLEALAYPGAAPGVKREEGFAEFGRWYLTNPDHARRIAPQFYDAFEAAMKADAPRALSGMQAVQAGYKNLLDSASIDVATGSIAYTGRKGTLRELADEAQRRGVGSVIRRLADDAYTAFVDDLHPLAVATRKLTALFAENTGQKLDLKRANDPYALARLSREAYAAGHSDIMHGVTPYRGLDPEGVSLADALETAGLATTRLGSLKPEATREFDAYLIARRMVHEWDRYAAGDLPNPPDRNTKQFHQQVIADAEAQHPTWAKAADQAHEFQNNLWKKEFDAGLITEESYRNGIDQHPDYVPLMRDMSDRGPGGAGKPRGALQFAGGVKAFEGSSRDIISPLSSIIRRSYELNAIIKRNDTLKALDDLAQAAGRGAGAIVERLPAKQMEAINVQAADALEQTAKEMGLSGRDLSTVQKLADDATNQDTTITLFKQSEFSPRKGEAVVFVWRDGKKTPLLLADGEFGQQMFTALAGMNKDLQNVVVDSMAAMTQVLRYGVTLSPEFMAANVIRDQVATWINSDVGFVPVVDMVRGAASVLRDDASARRYATAGGMTGGANVAATRKPFPKTDAEAELQLQMLRKKGYNIRRLAKGPWRALAEATDLSETSTRMGVFKRGFDLAKRRGLSDYEALIESGFTSRDYLDFGRHGSKMVSAARIVTFLNAQVQGLDKTLRVLTAGGNLKRVLMPLTKEARTPAEQRALGHAYKAWGKLAALGAFGLGLRMIYGDDPEYQEIGDQLRATNWIFKSGGQWVFIPKPFELATVSNILERAYEGTVLKDPTAGERLLSDFRNTIAPPHEIPALSVPFAIGSNRDHLGRPIVPDHLRGTVDPQLQFSNYTSDLGKLIGRTFKVSPAVVDYVITGYGGSLGRYVLQGSNLIGEAVTGRPRTAAGPEDWFLSRRFIRDISRGSTSQAKFWDEVSRDGGDLTRAEGSFRSLMRDGKDAEGAAYLNRLDPAERAWVIAKVFGGEGEGKLHPLARTQAVVSLVGDFRTSIREGQLRDATGNVVPLTPRQRRTIDSALSDFALAEMRNALIDTGLRGWSQKDRMDSAAPLARIGRASEPTWQALAQWLENEHVATAMHPQQRAAADAAWQARRAFYEERVDPAFAMQQMRMERSKEGTKRARYEEELRTRGGAYAPSGRLDFSSRAE